MGKPQKIVERAAEALDAAGRATSLARRALANHTYPGEAAPVIPGKWKWAQRLLDQRRPGLMKIPGVVGVGLGNRVRDGVETDEPCVTVFVRRKFSEQTLEKRTVRRLPRYLRARDGRRLAVDVVQLGRLKRHGLAGESFGPGNPPRRATLGAAGIDLELNVDVGITAMHVTGLAAYQPEDVASYPVPFCMPSRYDDPDSGVVGQLLRGTMADVDAATVQLGLPCQNFIPGIGQIAGWRPVVAPTDTYTIVRMHGATSGYQSGYITNPCVDLREEENLQQAILVRIESDEGDSGSPLVDSDQLLLGFLVGTGSSGYRVFTPVHLVLALLQCNIVG